MKKFQKRREDFICIHCKKKIEGDGYTDHCPYCLYSLHVDINPGDRMEECRGKMVPEGVVQEAGKQLIAYKCIKCKYRHRVRIAKNDNIQEIIKLSTKIITNNGKRRTKKESKREA